MTNREKFRAAYLEKLAEAHAKHPEEYAYPADGIPVVVDKMIIALAAGTARNSNAIKAACRKVGIKSTYAAIKAYLAVE